MKKIFMLTLLTLLGANGCAWLTQQATSLWNNTEGPIVEETGQTQNDVRLVVRAPADNCTFKGGILGDANPDEAGLPSSVLNISSRIREGLVSNARRLGGNTVWLRTTDWSNPDVSQDYYEAFSVNNVEYSALVYDCPAE